MVPSFYQKATGASRIVYLVLLIAYASSIWFSIAKWIAYGSVVEETKVARACAQSCTCPFLGALSESLVSWHSSSFGRLCCITSIYSRVARFKPVDTLEVAQAAL